MEPKEENMPSTTFITRHTDMAFSDPQAFLGAATPVLREFFKDNKTALLHFTEFGIAQRDSEMIYMDLDGRRVPMVDMHGVLFEEGGKTQEALITHTAAFKKQRYSENNAMFGDDFFYAIEDFKRSLDLRFMTALNSISRVKDRCAMSKVGGMAAAGHLVWLSSSRRGELGLLMDDPPNVLYESSAGAMRGVNTAIVAPEKCGSIYSTTPPSLRMEVNGDILEITFYTRLCGFISPKKVSILEIV